MTRRARGAPLGLAIPAVLITSLAFAGQASAASCAANGSVTIVRKNDLRIYRVSNTVWVCSTLYGHRIRMAVNATQVTLWRRPSTQTFAYAVPKGAGAVFGSRNLKTGALLRGHMFPSGTFGPVTITALVAKSNGSIAYIYSSGIQGTHEYAQSVEKVDTTGYHVLDSTCAVCLPNGASVNTSFLQIVGGAVQWMDNSVLRSASFT
jgi:hypothetical protein